MATAPAVASIDQGFALAETYWAKLIEDEPLLGSGAGDLRCASLLPDFSRDGRRRREATQQWLLTQRDHGDLGAGQQVTRALDTLTAFARAQLLLSSTSGDRLEIAGPVTGPLAVLGQVVSLANIATDTDASAYIQRLRAFPGYITRVCEYGDWLLGADHLLPRGMLDLTWRRVSRFLGNADAASIAVGVIPAAMASRRQACEDTFRACVIPALSTYADFLARYRAAAPAGDGLAVLPDGDAVYEACLAYWTGEQWQTGQLSKVVGDELRKAADAAAQTLARAALPALPDAVAAARRDTIVSNGDQLMSEAQRILAGAWAVAGEIAHEVPDRPCEVRPVQGQSDPEIVHGTYRVPSASGRPGTFYLDVELMAAARASYNLPVVIYHEGVPGHHLQAIVQLAQPHLPTAVKACGYATGYAATEGWAVYAETLAEEHDMYKDPAAKVGFVQAQYLRACRLQADIGLHTQGWTRAQAAAAFAGCGLTPGEIDRELDRCIGWPGQGSCYRLGLAALQESRQRFASGSPARSARDFHSLVLGAGAQTLGQLRAMFTGSGEDS